ncbi:MAG: hypothetical protein LUQ32_01350 [Methanomicrobiales archaeon]|nr:hypothetical protein [Methanomicrobiales archaeon]
MEPAPAVDENPPPAPPDRRKWAIIALIIVIGGIAAAASLPGLLPPHPADQAHPIMGTIPQTTITPPTYRTPRPATSVTPGATPSVTPSTTPGGPPGFTVTISPVQASAGKGETVTYTMKIEAQNGFSGKIHMELVAGVLFFSQTYDLGIQEPPYPKTIQYPFTVPDNLWPGAAVNGILRSTGDGITREDQLTLTVR